MADSDKVKFMAGKILFGVLECLDQRITEEIILRFNINGRELVLRKGKELRI